MSHMRQVSQKGIHLGQTIRGYKGYSDASWARRTHQVFSEEVLTRLSEAAATVSRMKRLMAGNIGPDAMLSLDLMTERTQILAKYIADTVPTKATLNHLIDNGKSQVIIDLDSSILEKVGSINQALSMMDLEGGVGVQQEDLDSICELLDGLGNQLRERAILIAG
jgi:hypothetical protein